MTTRQLDAVLKSLDEQNLSILGFLEALTQSNDHADYSAIRYLVSDTNAIHSIFYSDARTKQSTEEWALSVAEGIFVDEVLHLSRQAGGWHFNASKATAEKLESFDIGDMASSFEQDAPRLWTMLATLLTANPLSERRRSLKEGKKRKECDEQSSTTDDERESPSTPDVDDNEQGTQERQAEDTGSGMMRIIFYNGGDGTEGTEIAQRHEEEGMGTSAMRDAPQEHGGDTHSSQRREGEGDHSSATRDLHEEHGDMRGVQDTLNAQRRERGGTSAGAIRDARQERGGDTHSSQRREGEGDRSSATQDLHEEHGDMRGVQDTLNAQRRERGGTSAGAIQDVLHGREGDAQGMLTREEEIINSNMIRGVYQEHGPTRNADEENIDGSHSDGSSILWDATDGVADDDGTAMMDIDIEDHRTIEQRLIDMIDMEELDENRSQTSDMMWEEVGHVPGEPESAPAAATGDTNSETSDAMWATFGTESAIQDDGVVREDDAIPRGEPLRDALLRIKQITCMSILLQSTNLRCNAFQSVIGVFLHACNTPEKVVEVLAHSGISISSTAINNAVTSLSEKASKKISDLGKTLLASLAYDNFDIDMKTAVPRVEKSEVTLKHLTSATLIPMIHGITKDDLKCSGRLWESSPINPHPSLSRPAYCFEDLLQINQEEPRLALTRHQRFRAWKFRYDLVQHGPSYFRKFIQKLGQPYESVCQIPVAKTTQIPARGMDINESTAKGNADVIEALLAQGHIAEEAENGNVSLEDHVVLFHGDLSTGERIRSVQESRCIEAGPWQRLQSVIFVPGLFHLKMACADALFRTYLEPKESQHDPDGLMKYVSIIRPKETGKMGSKPGFRRMHDVVQHTGLVLRLDCWRVEVSSGRRSEDDPIASLEDFSARKPLWDDIVAMSERIASKYVAGENIDDIRQGQISKHDTVFENATIRNRDFLFYEEITWALNRGDIGAVEMCILPWSMIFRATGKHKYANNMLRFLFDLHFVYDERLRHAIRMSWLCNPTGKEGKFRPIDWLVELNNLYTKYIYGGTFSNRTVKRILDESPIIETYRQCINNVERNFRLSSLTIQHANPDMTRTLSELTNHIKQRDTHKINPHGRKAGYAISDNLTAGLDILLCEEAAQGMSGEESSNIAGGTEDPHATTEAPENVDIEPEDLL